MSSGIALAGASVVVLGALWAALRHERPYGLRAQMLAIVLAPIPAVVHAVATDVEWKMPVLAGAVAGGVLLGALAGRSVSFRVAGGTVLVAGSGWLMLPSALAVAAVQVAGVFEAVEPMVLGLLALNTATGFAVGALVVIALRGRQVRPQLVAGPACPACGAAVEDGWRFCLACGRALARPEVAGHRR